MTVKYILYEINLILRYIIVYGMSKFQRLINLLIWLALQLKHFLPRQSWPHSISCRLLPLAQALCRIKEQPARRIHSIRLLFRCRIIYCMSALFRRRKPTEYLWHNRDKCNTQYVLRFAVTINNKKKLWLLFVKIN